MLSLGTSSPLSDLQSLGQSLREGEISCDRIEFPTSLEFNSRYPLHILSVFRSFMKTIRDPKAGLYGNLFAARLNERGRQSSSIERRSSRTIVNTSPSLGLVRDQQVHAANPLSATRRKLLRRKHIL
jgi:hypothetical protein